MDFFLRLVGAQVEVAPQHIPGLFNLHADALSRLSRGAAVPEALQGVQRHVPRERSELFYYGWARDILLKEKLRSARAGKPHTPRGGEPRRGPLAGVPYTPKSGMDVQGQEGANTFQ